MSGFVTSNVTTTPCAVPTFVLVFPKSVILNPSGNVVPSFNLTCCASPLYTKLVSNSTKFVSITTLFTVTVIVVVMSNAFTVITLSCSATNCPSNSKSSTFAVVLLL